MAKKGPRQLPRAERFWARVDTSGDCWLWTGAINKQRGGYGYFYDDDQRLRRAHRVAWELHRGDVLTEAQYLLHSCDVPPCVRPDHLSIGDQLQNLRQMSERGRAHKTGERGTDRYNAVLNDDLVRQARVLRDSGQSVAPLARAAGVSYEVLLSAASWKSWKHVED